MRIFLWLISVVAVYGLLSLVVLRPSLVYTRSSTGPLEAPLKREVSEVSQAGVVCVPLKESIDAP
jgi:hypothetical protein